MYITVRWGDTLTSLALTYFADETAALQIASANNLDPPFITDDAAFVSSAPAGGEVQFTLTGSGPVTVPAGTAVQTTAGSSGQIRTYTTQTPLTLNATGNTGTVAVLCTLAGPLGNIGPQRVGVTAFPGVTVTNPGPLDGGYYLNVARPGAQLWIPETTSSSAQPNPPAVPSLTQSNENGGIGILITPVGGMQWGADDLALAQGAQEIGIEVGNLLRTLRGTLWYFPGSGSLLPSVVGMTATDGQAQAAIWAESDSLQDSRIAAAAYTVQGSTVTPGWTVLLGELTLQSGTAVTQTVQLQQTPALP